MNAASDIAVPPPAASHGGLNWRGESLSPASIRVALSARVVAEIDAVVARLRSDPLPPLALSAAEFGLDATRATMARVKRMLDRGPGLALLDPLPVADWSDGEARAVHWLLGTLVGRPVAQKWDGTMLYDVRDTGLQPGNGVRPDQTSYEQNFHTDNSYNLAPPAEVGLLCVRQAASGGDSAVVSFLAAHEAMRARDPALLARLYRPFHFDRQREHAPGDRTTTFHPFFEIENGRPAARLSRFQVVNGHRLAGVALDPEGLAAMETFEAVLNQPGLALGFRLEPGQIQWLNNRQIGHRRTAFVDHDGPERKRLLIRLWLRDRGSRAYNG